MTYCLKPMTVKEIGTLVGADFVTNFQKEMDYILQPLRKYISMGRPLSLGKEIWEYAVSDSIPNAVWNGAGHSMIDVKIGDSIGIDVKSVSKQEKSKLTTEASIFQNFNQDAKTYFSQQHTQGVWDIHVQGWLDKISTIKKYYMLGIIRDKATMDCSLCGFRVVNVKTSLDEHRYTKTTVKFQNLIDPAFAEIHYYNSKTRLEIKLKEKCWTDTKYHLPIYKF
jgi:hypothetical protein